MKRIITFFVLAHALIQCYETDSNNSLGNSTYDSDTWPAMEDCTGGKLDIESRLCWHFPEEKTRLAWQDAVEYCEELQEASHDDWRLPKIQEMISLIRGCLSRSCEVSDPICLEEFCGEQPSCDSCPMGEGPGTDGCYWDPDLTAVCHVYWSSSTVAENESYAWDLVFDSGFANTIDKQMPFYVACVRST